jgi:hypothetical protein
VSKDDRWVDHPPLYKDDWEEKEPAPVPEAVEAEPAIAKPDEKMTYQGCWHDDFDRDLNYGPQTTGYDLESCRQKCMEFPLFAL